GPRLPARTKRWQRRATASRLDCPFKRLGAAVENRDALPRLRLGLESIPRGRVESAGTARHTSPQRKQRTPAAGSNEALAAPGDSVAVGLSLKTTRRFGDARRRSTSLAPRARVDPAR